jgi:hypothetical protein
VSDEPDQPEDEGSGNDEIWLVNRRDFLKLAATSATVACGPMTLISCEGCDEDGPPGEEMGPVLRWIPIRRPDDLLAIDLGLINLEDQDGELVRVDPGERACIVLRLPGQHLHEEVININQDVPDRRFEALFAGPSRLVFEIGDDVSSIPFNLAGVLETVRTSQPVVSVQAAPPQGVELPPTMVSQGSQNGGADGGTADAGASDAGAGTGGGGLPMATLDIAASPFEARQSMGGEDTEDPPEEGLALIKAVKAGHSTRQAQATQFYVASQPPPPPPNPDQIISPDTTGGKGRPVAPEPHETAIEFPTRLIISPHKHVRFVHMTAPHESSEGRIALWHTRMVPLDADGALDPQNKALSTVRAIWARGAFNPNRLVEDEEDGDLQVLMGQNQSEVKGPLTSDTREQIVHQSSNFEDLVDLESGEDAEPLPIRVDQLMLTSLGAFFDGQGDWTQKEGLNLLRWAQRSTLGRDHYVEVAFAGYLYPWGHKAIYVEIAQRIVPPAGQQGDRRAFLQKHALILVAEPDVNYDPGPDASGPIAGELRQTPVRRVRLLDLVSPKLAAADAQNTAYKPILANSQDYLFPAQIFDAEGRTHKVELPAVWVPGARRDWSDNDFNGSTQADVRMLHAEYGPAQFGGSRVAFTPPDDEYDAMRYEAQTVTFADSELSDDAQSSSGVYLPFLPRMTEAKIGLDAARGLLKEGDDQVVTFAQNFLDDGFGGANAQFQILFELANELPMKFSSQSDKSGGFVSPDMALKAVSRIQGLIGGDPGNIAMGDIAVDDVFGDVGDLLPKLFGAVSLLDILDAAGLDVTPKLLSDVQDELNDLLTDIGRLRDQLDFGEGDLEGMVSEYVTKQSNGYLEGAQDLVNDLEMQLMSLKSDLENCIDNLASTFDDFSNKILMGEYTDALGVLTSVADPQDPDAPLTCFIDLLEQIPFFPVAAMKRLRAAADRIDEVLANIEKVEPIFQAIEDAQEMLEQRVIRLEWSPRLKEDSGGFFIPHKSDAFSLGVEVRPQAVGGKPAGADIFAALEEFDIVLFPGSPAITIGFERIVFEVRAGSKPDIDVVLAGLTFGGPLKFIEKIKEALPLDGFSDPPEIDVDITGLRAYIDFPIPNIAVGVFALENMAVSAELKIPFLGDTIRLTFGFCSKENPFVLTVSMLGGGGYVGITITPKGLDRLEVALEFGASLSVNFGVASGGVSIVAGIFLAVEAMLVELTGYFRFRGYVIVLGIIGASLELGMELQYKKVGSDDKVMGRAWLILEITVLCFSKEVKIEAERKLSGKAEDPTFAEVMAPGALGDGFDPVVGSDQPNTPWANYVNAFA